MTAGPAFSTDQIAPHQRAGAWTRAIGQTFFPLHLRYQAPKAFRGTLRRWDLGDVQASCLASDAVHYERRADHLRDGGEEDMLLTIPTAAPVRFLQMGREVECHPGGFLLERGNEPYEFSYARSNDLVVAKIPYRTLDRRLPDPGRHCAISFDLGEGVGALLHEVVRASEARARHMSERARAVVGQQVVDLLALAVEQDPRANLSADTSVRRAHLARIGREIARAFAEPWLSPDEVAGACGISVRYLHDLCRRDGASFRDRLRQTRHEAARQALSALADTRSITEIAYACGFSDASSFARSYRVQFGESPRETRMRARQPGQPSDA